MVGFNRVAKAYQDNGFVLCDKRREPAPRPHFLNTDNKMDATTAVMIFIVGGLACSYVAITLAAVKYLFS